MAQPKIHPTPAARQAAYRQRQHEHTITLNLLTSLPDWSPENTQQPKVRWQLLAHIAFQAMTSLRNEMQDYQDARTEAWQESDALAEFDDRQSAIDDAIAQLLEAFPDTETKAKHWLIEGLHISTKTS